MIDTHTHLYLPEFEEGGGGEAAVRRAIEAGVEKMIFPNVELATIEPMKALAEKFRDSVSMAMGLHPTEVNDGWSDAAAVCLEELGKGRYVAVGEVGIDLYWDKTYAEEQMRAFDMQAGKAEEMDLPVIIHCREGLDQALEVLQGHPRVRAVFHSFGGTAEDVDRIRRVGDYCFGINGIVTFKNCKVRETLPEITLDRILLETDSPYLAPVPNRGKRNESAYLPLVAKHISEYLGVPMREVEDATTDNAYSLFPGLKQT
ncbi:MAG: TatD family hydrolase [Clostridium sp.]|nr:TatD family hydrolase [Clostridium sp.]